VLTTGNRSRLLSVPDADLPDGLELRSVFHAETLKAKLQPGTQLAVIGSGSIGLEVAASARKLGYHVTVLE